MSNPKLPGDDLAPDSTDPTNDLLARTRDDVEPIEEDGEPLGGNFA